MGRTWRKRKRERPEEIRAAAMIEFSRVGPDAATMAQIAIRAGVTKGTIYLYYASKSALLDAVQGRSLSPRVQPRNLASTKSANAHQV